MERRTAGKSEKLGARILPILLVLPLVMLGSIILASVESTPVTGRWRIIMLSPEEEGELVDSIVGGGELERRDWEGILGRVLKSEGGDVLGGKVSEY